MRSATPRVNERAKQLIFIVEYSRYLWHRLAIERTAQSSPDQLDIATAKAHLCQDIVDDQAMLNGYHQ